VKRYHEERDRTLSAHRKHLRSFNGWPTKSVFCICDLQTGRFRERHAQGCNKTLCYLCKGGKLLRRPTVKDLIEQDRERGSMAEAGY
jgi:hypothetical protein